MPPPVLETDARREAFARLIDGLGAREPFVVVTGEAGTGKTLLVRDAAQAWGARAMVAFVANAAMSRNELVEQIARRFGAEPAAGSTKPQLLEMFERCVAEVAGRGQIPVIVIDDAHDLGPDLLGELRLLVNASVDAGRPLEVVLVDPALEALRQRIAVRCVTASFSPQETRRFLHEVIGATLAEGPGFLPKKACRAIHEASTGRPRAIQTLAAEAIRRARASASPLVTADHVRMAAAGRGWDVAPMPDSPPDAGDDPAEERGVKAQPPAAAVDSARDPAATPPASPAPKPAPDSAPRPAPRAAAPAPPRPARIAPPQVTAPDPPPVPVSGEASVQAWVGNFINPDEPRFGDLLKAGKPRGLGAPAPASERVTGGANGTSDEDEKAEGAAPAAVAATPRAARPRLPWQRARRTRTVSRTTMALAGTALILAVVALLMWNRTDEPAPGSAAAPTATDGKDAGRTAAATAAAKTSRARSRATDPGQLYALEVGSYLDVDRATAERDRLAADTGLKGWILLGAEGDGDVVRVILGPYRTEERARWGAETLLDRGVVTEAAVIPLPPRRERH
jgi:general secretion pathway protein A